MSFTASVERPSIASTTRVMEIMMAMAAEETEGSGSRATIGVRTDGRGTTDETACEEDVVMLEVKAGLAGNRDVIVVGAVEAVAIVDVLKGGTAGMKVGCVTATSGAEVRCVKAGSAVAGTSVGCVKASDAVVKTRDGCVSATEVRCVTVSVRRVFGDRENESFAMSGPCERG